MGVEIRFLKWGFKLENKIKPRYKLSIFIDISIFLEVVLPRK